MDEQKLLKRKRKATLDNNKTLLTTVCTDLAELYAAEGRYRLAVDEYKTLADIYKAGKQQISYAQANRGIGEAYLGLHEFHKALEHQQKYLEIAKSENDKLEEQRALATIGHTYLSWYLETPQNPDKNNLHMAFKTFMKSLIICESLSDIGKLDKMDMTARLFCNLGVVQDCLGNFKKSLELLTKSIQICKQHDIFEQLYRSYFAVASLYEKTNDYKSVILNYNLAIEVAKKFRTKPDMLCSALFSKAATLIKLGDFHSAKPVLYKAYKINSPNEEDRKSIEHYLRVVVVICRTEDQLVLMDDQVEVKKLYEKLGDCACELKNYKKAVDYYKKMLETAEKSGCSKRELATCYYSLAQTYKDCELYDQAVEYFEKEYSIVRDKLKDSLNTLSQIADAKESACKPLVEVKAVYERAFEDCIARKNSKEERRMVARYLEYLRRSKNNTEAFKIEQHLNKLEEQDQCYSSSDSESIDTDVLSGNIGEDVCLDNLTDMSDDSDNDNLNADGAKTARPKRKRNIVVKNNKGETKLHLAAINGNFLAAQVLVDQGHPVNIRDHAGWLPIHEAANNGHLDIVRLLVDNGASINDRGDKNGITPLHDAAYNGHVEIMELLLDKGASGITMTDEGDTPLQALQNWMNGNEVESHREAKFKDVLKRLSEAMEKTGQQVKGVANSHVPTSLTVVDKENIGESQASQKRTFIRRNQSFKDDYDTPHTPEKSRTESSEEGACEYRKVMETLKNKNKNHISTSKQGSGTKRPALIPAEEDTWDDWLEDDIGTKHSNKKRKFSLSTNTSQVRNVPRNRVSVDSNQSSDSNDTPNEYLTEFGDDDMEIVDVSPTPTCYGARPNTGSTVKKKTNQGSLLDAGFSKSTTSTNQLNVIKKKTPPLKAKSKPFQLKMTNPRFSDPHESPVKELRRSDSFSSDVSQPSSQNITIADPTLFVDVRIEGRLYRVPVLLSQVQTQTIKWLAEQAAYRYASKESMKPTLELETKSGAVLADEDLLSLLFPMGAMQAEPVEARVLRWSLPPLIDRYVESCAHMETGQNDYLSKLAQELSDVLNVSHKGLRGGVIAPFCRAINHQSNLLEINLSGNFLSLECVKMLCSSLGSLTNLQSLNLSCTGLQTSHLSLISNAVTSKSLTKVDLSDNRLKNECLPHLSTFTQKLLLKSLNISAIGLRSDVDDVQLHLNHLQSLDVSDNDITKEDLKKLLKTLNTSTIKTLNISRLRPTNCQVLHTLSEEIFKLEPIQNLRTINLSRCNIHDAELFNILWYHTQVLTSMDLSYNCDLTGLSLKRLLEHASLTDINLIGCRNIFNNFQDDVIINKEQKRERCLKTYVDDEMSSRKIVNIFKSNFDNENVIVNELPNFLEIRVVYR